MGKLLIETFINGTIAGKYYEGAILNVGTNNVPAKLLYERYGFVVKHEIPNFYNSDSAYCMECIFTALVPYSGEQMSDKTKLTNLSPEPQKPGSKQTNNTHHNKNLARKEGKMKDNTDNASEMKFNNKKQAIEPEVDKITHLIQIEHVTFRISSKPKEYS